MPTPATQGPHSHREYGAIEIGALSRVASSISKEKVAGQIGQKVAEHLEVGARAAEVGGSAEVGAQKLELVSKSKVKSQPKSVALNFYRLISKTPYSTVVVSLLQYCNNNAQIPPGDRSARSLECTRCGSCRELERLTGVAAWVPARERMGQAWQHHASDRRLS